MLNGRDPGAVRERERERERERKKENLSSLFGLDEREKFF